MTLTEKVKDLKLSAYRAARVADFWESKISEHGEHKAEAFYRHIGLNHIEVKGFDWEGLTLSREPKEHEKIAVKGVSQAQQSAKESITSILLSLRQELILDGLEGIKKLDPATYHTLILEVPPEFRRNLRDRLISTYRQGRRLIAVELMREGKQDEEEDEFDDLDTLTDLSTGRVVNDVQARLIGGAADFVLLGLTGAVLINAVRTQITDGSVSYINNTAAGVGHKVIALGRDDEMRRRGGDIERYEYSALLDSNTCPQCFALDGTEAASIDDLPEVPLLECDGGSLCRCFIVAIAPGG